MSEQPKNPPLTEEQKKQHKTLASILPGLGFHDPRAHLAFRLHHRDNGGEAAVNRHEGDDGEKMRKWFENDVPQSVKDRVRQRFPSTASRANVPQQSTVASSSRNVPPAAVASASTGHAAAAAPNPASSTSTYQLNFVSCLEERPEKKGEETWFPTDAQLSPLEHLAGTQPRYSRSAARTALNNHLVQAGIEPRRTAPYRDGARYAGQYWWKLFLVDAKFRRSTEEEVMTAAYVDDLVRRGWLREWILFHAERKEALSYDVTAAVAINARRSRGAA
ncbi:MAG: hypothetical protein Q9159_000520 [Coniocarpon cinnabarinum]